MSNSLFVGYPFSPNVVEGANCGPTVLAALLGIDTGKAMQLMNKGYPKGWHGGTNVGHIKAVLNHHDIAMKKTKEYDGIRALPEQFPYKTHVLLFIQIEGPWIGKGWRSEYTRTHWSLAYQQRIIDVNNPRIASHFYNRPRWVWLYEWEVYVIPSGIATWAKTDKHYKGADGWHVRSAYFVEDNNNG
jgi:hypothetical protein